MVKLTPAQGRILDVMRDGDWHSANRMCEIMTEIHYLTAARWFLPKMRGLAKRGLLENRGDDVFRITRDGLAAVNKKTFSRLSLR